MKEAIYKALLKELSIGFAYFEIILDATGNPFDFKILDSNQSFQEISGLSSYDTVGKKFSEIKGKVKNSLFRTLSYYAEIAQSEGSGDYEILSEDRERWIMLKSFQIRLTTLHLFLVILLIANEFQKRRRHP